MTDMTLVSSLKTAYELVHSLLQERDARIINKKIVELNTIILSAQQGALASNVAQFALVEEKRKLEAELAGLKAWEAEKQKYELATIAPGVFAYRLKENAECAEPFHYICQACYQHGKKSILQKKIRGEFMGSTELYVCHECDSELVDHESWKRSDDKRKAEGRR